MLGSEGYLVCFGVGLVFILSKTAIAEGNMQ